MNFTKDSMIVKCWVMLIESGTKTLKDVPKLWNLKEVVTNIIEGK
ncbi:MAG: hypothetical protein SOR77_01605 [Peptoniphilus sp.]|nr:hypothetical protein [Peptoniphilus sp.]MDY2986308.1 hypothetical protein [Peptoniphilus sp.]